MSTHMIVKGGDWVDSCTTLQLAGDADKIVVDDLPDECGCDYLSIKWDLNNFDKLKLIRDSGVCVLEFISDFNELTAALEFIKTKVHKNYEWSRYSDNGLEVSSKGGIIGKRFSPFFMRWINGETLENIYQLDVKGYRKLGHTSWKSVKSLPPVDPNTNLIESAMNMYLAYFYHNPSLLYELAVLGLDKVFTDVHANSDNTQARTYSVILNQLLGFIK